MTANALYAFVTILVMINPVEAATAFGTLTSGMNGAQKASIALRSTIIATIILLSFGFGGDATLTALGISFAAFRVAGGLLLMRVGFNMVFGDSSSQGDKGKPAAQPDPTVFPLAIPIITGPGAMTAMIGLVTKTHDNPLKAVALIVIALVVMLITYVAMRAYTKLEKFFGPSGIDALGRVIGIIVTAIAIQFIVDGIGELFPVLLRGG